MKRNLVALGLAGLAASALTLVPSAAHAADPSVGVMAGSYFGNDSDCSSIGWDSKTKELPANKKAEIKFANAGTIAATSDSTDKVRGKASLEAVGRVNTTAKGAFTSSTMSLTAATSTTAVKGDASLCANAQAQISFQAYGLLKVKKPGILKPRLTGDASGTAVCQVYLAGPKSWVGAIGAGILRPSMTATIKAPKGLYQSILYCQLSASPAYKAKSSVDIDFTVGYTKS